MHYFLEELVRYDDFRGRTSRKAFWMYVLFYLIFYLIILSLSGGSKDNLLTDLYQLILAVPTLAIVVRRMHDSDRKWWALLIPFYNLYLELIPGTKGPNRFGPDPRDKEKKEETPTAPAVPQP